MGRRGFLFLVFFTNFLCFLSAQDTYEKGYFRSPVNHDLRLSGSFAELRPNHFHAGIDIKPNQNGGKNYIYAIADAYVSRINIKATGYGQALYLDHPNGYTSVYAHLKDLRKPIKDYITKLQYEQQTFEINHYPAPNELLVKKGEIIGEMGNKGRSYGKHLHFEIRETVTEKPVNPLLFDFEVADTRLPLIQGIYLYALDSNQEPYAKKYYATKKISEGSYQVNIASNQIKFGAWRSGIGIRTYDLFNAAPNYNGVYAIKMFVDEELRYHYQADKFSFDETRYLNAHIDYELQQLKKNYFHRCYKLPGNKLAMYPSLVNNGVVDLYEDQSQSIKIEVSDIKGNTSTLVFKITRSSDVLELPSENYNYIIYHDQPFSFQQEHVGVDMEQGSVYSTSRVSVKDFESKYPQVKSHVCHVGENIIPIQNYFDMRVLPVGATDTSKLIAQTSTPKGAKNYYTGKMTDDYFEFSTRALGKYHLLEDKTPPTITPHTFKYSMQGASQFAFKSSDSQSGLTSYEAYVDGQWILLEYDAKSNRLIHKFDGKITKGVHEIKVLVQDGVGNQNTYSSKFVR